MFLAGPVDSESHNVSESPLTLNSDIFDSTNDFPFSDVYSNSCDFPDPFLTSMPSDDGLERSPSVVSTDTMPLSDVAISDTENEQNQSDSTCTISTVTSPLVQPMEFVDSTFVSPLELSDSRSVVSDALDTDSSSSSSYQMIKSDMISTLHEQRRLACKQRRLRRMMIVKKKRELGLISYLNSKTVRYKQMQSSARLKSRYKGRFVANAYD